jgi:glutamine amidotransferase-like uncharacterized protein
MFLAGVGHVSGGPGADTWDQMGVIASWVENGTAPYSIVASHIENGNVAFTRPHFPFPLQAYYNGTGNSSLASSFYAANKGGDLVG